MYAKFWKRVLDIILSAIAIIILSPIFLIMTIVGAIVMKGNPFFVQPRPGKIDPKTGKEKIFKLIKFRSMTQEKDKDGNLLPDEQRMTKYGEFIRKTSADEWLECINIIKGDMSWIGPRPLLVKYLDRYSEEQRHRHDVRPGLTGWAQVNGRNLVSWEERFKMDVWYTRNISFSTDVKILIATVKVVLNRDGVSSGTSVTMEEFMGTLKGQSHE